MTKVTIKNHGDLVGKDSISGVMNKEHKIKNKEQQYIILVVEDEYVNFMFLEILLLEKMNASITVLHAEDGLKAVEICKKNDTIDLILMDIKMPRMNGFEATELIREFRPNTPIIIQSAYHAESERNRAIELGCNDFISKPVSLDKLNSVLKKLINI